MAPRKQVMIVKMAIPDPLNPRIIPNTKPSRQREQKKIAKKIKNLLSGT